MTSLRVNQDDRWTTLCSNKVEYGVNTVTHGIVRIILAVLQGAGKWLKASAYVSVISRLVVRPRSVLLALTIQLLSACH